MTIWILVWVMMLSMAAIGYRQGAIRESFSLIGIIVSALLAGPLAKYAKPIVLHLGIHDPTLIWLVSPLIVFLALLIPFKSVGFFVHRKVEIYFKYKEEGIQLIRWSRLNARLGLGLGLINGLAYLLLISFIIFDFSYCTTQIATSDNEGMLVKLLNRMGRDSETTGFAQIARAMDPMPDSFFKYVDFAGLLRQNPQLRDRLGDYPMFISLTEREDFKQLGKNTGFQNAWKQNGPIQELLGNEYFKSMLKAQATTKLIWDMVQKNFDDLCAYLQTGQSAKYASKKIVGRWTFNITATTSQLMETRKVTSSREMRMLRAWVTQSYAKTAFVAGADGQAFLKNMPHLKTQQGQPPTTEIVTYKGKWKEDGDTYKLSFTGPGQKGSMPAEAEDTRLTIKDDKTTLVFNRE
jgi:uncharacterized membrane protein required for colicin V production